MKITNDSGDNFILKNHPEKDNEPQTRWKHSKITNVTKDFQLEHNNSQNTTEETTNN